MSQLERVNYIVQLLKDKGHFTRKEIEKRFEINNRTVKRDIEYMRERMSYDIVYNQSERFYENRGDMPSLIPGGNILSYAFLTGVAASGNLTPLMADDIRKIADDHLDQAHRELAGAIRYRFPQPQVFDRSILDGVLWAFRSRRACEITYAKPGERTQQRVIEPYRFQNYDGQWYIAAYCHAAGDIRQFALARIIRLEVTKDSYVSDYKDTELDDYCGRSYGVMRRGLRDAGIVDVTIRFYGAARDIVESQEWHPGQTIHKEAHEGQDCLVMTLPVESYEEILRRVLFHGIEAEIVAPADLRKRWQDHIGEMNRKFCGNK